ncbi:MAG: low molecular weight phosphotyrosine protein phosphatase [Xanthomonadales bacterium]|nr:low molecular weight phosphotyrosine protein phosphatase [Gammaproteobacteria bacterium]MBT8052430.1 low molecular weight phosphotyrosine protein phosphatase [Gammaproteobacteria bacterium]NND55947.1 low molecular weight phosphotyrosine protein phosphatase [Xanthomonadales bacterium]
MNFETSNVSAQPVTADVHRTPVQQSVLFVCLGNICRSPSAQGIFSHLAASRAGNPKYVVDSAGTHDYHVGKGPDARAVEANRRAGVDISTQRARQFAVADFDHFDHILVMDERNRAHLAEMCPPRLAHKVKPIVSLIGRDDLDCVPDPFHGEEKDFDDMVELLFDVCGATLDALDQHAA